MQSVYRYASVQPSLQSYFYSSLQFTDDQRLMSCIQAAYIPWLMILHVLLVPLDCEWKLCSTFDMPLPRFWSHFLSMSLPSCNLFIFLVPVLGSREKGGTFMDGLDARLPVRKEREQVVVETMRRKDWYLSILCISLGCGSMWLYMWKLLGFLVGLCIDNSWLFIL